MELCISAQPQIKKNISCHLNESDGYEISPFHRFTDYYSNNCQVYEHSHWSSRSDSWALGGSMMGIFVSLDAFSIIIAKYDGGDNKLLIHW